MKNRIKKILLTVVTIATVIVVGNYGVKNVQALNITEENIVVGKNQSVNVIEGAVTSDYIILLNENGTLPENVNYFEGNKEITVGEAEETKTVSYIQLTQSEVDKIGTPKTEIMPDTVSANAVSVNSVKMSEELWTVQEIAKEHWNNSANRKRINVTCDATAPTVTSLTSSKTSYYAGDTISLTINYSEKPKNIPNVTIAKGTVLVAQNSDTSFTATVMIPSDYSNDCFIKNEDIEYEISAPEDNYGNVGSAVTSKDSGAPKIQFVGRKELGASVNADISGNKSKIKPGDSVTITLTPQGASDIANKSTLVDAQINGMDATVNNFSFTYTFGQNDIEKEELTYSAVLQETYTNDNASKSITGKLAVSFDKTKPEINSAEVVQTGSVYLTDILQVRFTTSEEIKIDTIKMEIMGEAATVAKEEKRTKSGCDYVAQITLNDATFSKNSTLIDYVGSDRHILSEKINPAIMKIEDEAGNIKEVEAGNPSLYDVEKATELELVGLTPPIRPEEVTIEKEIANSFTAVASDEKILLKVSAKYPFKILKAGSKLFKFSDSEYEEMETDVVAVADSGNYIATVTSSSKALLEGQGIPFELKAQNTESTACKNVVTIQEGNITSGTNLNYDGVIPQIKNVATLGNGEESNKRGMAYVNTDGAIKLAFSVSEENAAAEVEVEGNKFTPTIVETKEGIQNWEVEGNIPINALIEGETLEYAIYVTDKAGNKAISYTEAIQEAQQFIYDVTAPAIEEQMVTIKNKMRESIENEKREYEGNYYVKPGDTATISCKVTDEATNHAVRKPEIVFLGEKVDVQTKDLDENAHIWNSTYLITETDHKINKAEGDLCVFNAKDCAGNEATPATILNDRFIVDATAPNVLVESLESNNKDSSKVKEGDIITVLFDTDEPVRNMPSDCRPEVKLYIAAAAGGYAERNCTVEAVTSADLPIECADKWKATYKITTEDGNAFAIKSDVTCKIKVKDKAENENENAEEVIEQQLEWTAPLKASAVTFESDNIVDGVSAKQYLVEGKKAILQFTINNPSANLEIAGSVAGSSNFTAIKSGAAYTITSDIVAKGTISDSMTGSEVPFELDITDEMGNNLKFNNKSATDYKGNKLLYTAPLKAEATVSSTNSKEPKRFVKDEDTVTIELKPNHKIEKVLSGKISGLNATLSTDKITYLIKNGNLKDSQAIDYQVEIQDEALQTFKIEKSSEMKYQEPIKLNRVSISSDNTNVEYVRNGQAVSIKSAYNHECSIKSASVLSRSASVGNKGTEIVSTLRISENESTVPEGVVEFDIQVEDDAGNTLNITAADLGDGKQVIYDRTAPDIRIEPVFNGFTNKDISMNYIFTDENLSADISVLVNKKERITESDKRGASTGAVLSKNLVLEGEGEFKIIANATDKAGNTTQSVAANVIVDKTSPQVTTTKISMEKPHTYPKGFVISDYFDIEEEYLKDIICKITDDTGSYDWDIDEPITEDGKKTIYLLATDMADNISSAISYDIYVDGTEPKPIVVDNLTKRTIDNGKNWDFVGQMVVSMSLAEMHMGDEEPDQFTELKLLNESGTVISDLLEKNQAVNGVYTLSVSEFGKYNLQLQAIDDVGNQLPTMLYKFELRDKTTWDKFYENKPLFFGSIATAVCTVGAATVGIQLSIRRKKKKL